jgi:hypothetical protein
MMVDDGGASDAKRNLEGGPHGALDIDSAPPVRTTLLSPSKMS